MAKKWTQQYTRKRRKAAPPPKKYEPGEALPRRMSKVSADLAAAYAWLVRYHERFGAPPLASEMARELGYNCRESAQKALRRLERLGLVRRVLNRRNRRYVPCRPGVVPLAGVAGPAVFVRGADSVEVQVPARPLTAQEAAELVSRLCAALTLCKGRDAE